MTPDTDPHEEHEQCAQCGERDCETDHAAQERDEAQDYERAHGPEVSR